MASSSSSFTKQSINLIRGDTADIVLDVEQNGVAYDVTDHTFKWTVRDQIDGTVLLQKTSEFGITIVNPTSGKILVSVDKGDTSSMEVSSKLPYDVEMTTPSGEVYTVALGDLKLTPDITE